MLESAFTGIGTSRLTLLCVEVSTTEGYVYEILHRDETLSRLFTLASTTKSFLDPIDKFTTDIFCESKILYEVYAIEYRGNRRDK